MFSLFSEISMRGVHLQFIPLTLIGVCIAKLFIELMNFFVFSPAASMKYYTYQPEAIKKAKTIVKRRSSLRQASEQTGVPFNTIRDHLKYDRDNMTEITRGRNRELADLEETDLANYAKYMSERGFPITRKVLKKLVVDIVKSSGLY